MGSAGIDSREITKISSRSILSEHKKLMFHAYARETNGANCRSAARAVGPVRCQLQGRTSGTTYHHDVQDGSLYVGDGWGFAGYICVSRLYDCKILTRVPRTLVFLLLQKLRQIHIVHSQDTHSFLALAAMLGTSRIRQTRATVVRVRLKTIGNLQTMHD